MIHKQAFHFTTARDYFIFLVLFFHIASHALALLHTESSPAYEEVAFLVETFPTLTFPLLQFRVSKIRLSRYPGFLFLNSSHSSQEIFC